MAPWLRRGLLVVLLFSWAAPAVADPLVMFLLSVAQEIIMRAARAPAQAPAPEPLESTNYPGTLVEPEHLQRIIDNSFTYLSGAQRAEVFHALHAALMEPKNAALRPTIIEHFIASALAVRDAQLRLAQLSTRDRGRLLNDFRSQVAELPEEDAKKLGELLRQHLLPVPRELNAQLLAAFDAR